MRTRIAKSWTFDAAHQLPNHDGKCRQPHGHTYGVTLVVSGEPQPIDGRPDEGMVIDFGVLDHLWRAIELHLDHRDLNGSLDPLDVPRTTSELIAAHLFRFFDDAMPPDVQVESVRVSETAKTYAEVQR